jgi:hypothetical protein
MAGKALPSPGKACAHQPNLALVIVYLLTAVNSSSRIINLNAVDVIKVTDKVIQNGVF